MNSIRTLASAGAFACLAPLASAQHAAAGARIVPPSTQAFSASSEAPMLTGTSPATSKGYVPTAIWTVGETFGGYTPVGIPDGIGAIRRGDSVSVFVNHELGEGAGAPYALKNGTVLTGARISLFNLSRQLSGGGASTVVIQRALAAYDTIYDRQGNVVTAASQVNQNGDVDDGFARFCSGGSIAAGTFGFVDNVYLTGEESGKPFLAHGGSFWALDVSTRTLWAVPAMGRGAWENATPLDTGDAARVAFLMGDDTVGAPLYLYVGQKNALGDGSFLDRNGLAVGSVYAWRADNGDLDPQAFNTTDSFRSGTFVAVHPFDAAKAGTAGYDAFGWADDDTLKAEADSLGCFSFSRPEDLSTNPYDGTQAVFNSTGRGQLYPADNWGTSYVVDVDFSDLSADLVVVTDSDALPVPDAGIRSQDNATWGIDGKAYINEDRSTSPSSLFGGTTGIEASVWQLDLVTRQTVRILEIDRSAVPAGQTDSAVGDIGNWESSGILDVTNLFPTYPGERLFLVDVQAHGISLGSTNLVEGGQLLLVSKIGL